MTRTAIIDKNDDWTEAINQFPRALASSANKGVIPQDVPTVVRTQLTDAELQQNMHFSIALKMRNFAELQDRVDMHEIISLDEMRTKYFPDPSEVANVRKWLIAQGFQVQQTNNGAPYLVSQIDGAYDASIGNGAGQTIGIVIDTFPNDSDLTKFWAANEVPQSLNSIQKAQVFPGTVPPSGEETLDVSWSSGIASGATIRIYAVEDSNLPTNKLDAAYQFILNELPSQPGLHQISMSYGLGELAGVASGQLQTDELALLLGGINLSRTGRKSLVSARGGDRY
jgi:subtilase family serine protease